MNQHSTPQTETEQPNHSVLVVNLYYPPDTASTGQLLHELCVGLVQSGTTVHVLTGQPNYTGSVVKAPSFEILDDVHVHRVSLFTSKGRSNLFKRVLAYTGFMAKAWYRALKIARDQQIDSVVTVSNPPMVGLIGRRISRKLNIPFNYILFDIHPDAIEIAGAMWMPPGISTLWRWLNRRIWNSANTIAVPGDYMKAHLAEAHGLASGKVKVLPLWATPEQSESKSSPSTRNELGIRDDSILIIHAGNIGLMHRFIDLVDAVGSVENLNIEMAVAGGGSGMESAKKHSGRKGYKNIKFLGYLEDTEFNALLQSADIAATTLIDGMEHVSMPSRALTYMSAGLPYLSIMRLKSDLGDLVAEEQCGWVAETTAEASSILTTLADDRTQITIAAQNASQAYAARFTRASGIRNYSQMITITQTDTRQSNR
jgi:colanic acid biosynthesis glycosyl transferase WcaI